MADLAIRTTTPARVMSLFLDEVQPILLLGAGASVTSGIPTAATAVEQIAKWAWCKQHGRSDDDPTVRRSDWWPWLTTQPWYRSDIAAADSYPQVVDRLLGVKSDRRNFFRRLVSPIDVPPSAGYLALADILHNRWISTVLTTNFDDCLQRAAVQRNRPHHIVGISTPDDYVLLNSSPADPQLIYLHGSVEHYTDKNITDEVQALDPELVSLLAPLLRDHPVIVVGYRGAEPSVMRDLFIAQARATGCLQGIYWCIRDADKDLPLPPLLEELAAVAGANFNIVPIQSFDHFLGRELLAPAIARKIPPRRSGTATLRGATPPDMRPMVGTPLTDIEGPLLAARVRQYADRLEMWKPDIPDDDWVRRMASQLDLATDYEGGHVPTMAGYLLFAREPSQLLESAHIDFSVEAPVAWLRDRFGDEVDITPTDENGQGRVARTIRGNLWSQLETLTDLLSAVNAQFRLKGEVSRDVNAYHPLAIKEAIVNAVVHRDYDREEPIKVLVDPVSIEVISPGGLIEELSAQVAGQPFQEAIANRRAPIKGYRNPVISDLFYGGGQMDRRGSGLFDIIRFTANNNGAVQLGPTPSNSHFGVRLEARPEAVDVLTNTAVSDEDARVRYTTNLLPFEQLPKYVWHSGTTAGSNRTFYTQARSAGLPVPPGMVHDGRFFSFYDLEQMSEAMVTPFDPGDIELLAFSELVNLPGGESVVLKLLHDLIFEHLKACGLWIEKDRRRAYFPKGDELERKVNYQARVRRATRTVVKARTKRDSDEVIYFEHKALNYSIMRFESDWAIVLNPGYVFTRDGLSKYLAPEKTNVLSTKRSARDFNQTVVQDVAFWLAVVSEGAEGMFALRCTDGNQLASFAPVVLLQGHAPNISVNSAAFDGGASRLDLDDDLERLEAELEELARSSLDVRETDDGR